MGVFVNNDTFYAGSTLDPESFIECTEDNMIDAGVRIMIENEQNWNTIMKAVGIDEVRSFAENGGVDVIHEGRVGDFLNKVVDFFKKLWQKVVGIFKKMVSLLDQQFQSDKDFVKKYRSDIIKKFANSKVRDNISVKIWKFSPNIGKITGEAVDNLNSAMHKSKDTAKFEKCTSVQDVIKSLSPEEKKAFVDNMNTMDNVGDTVRGWVLGETTEYTETEFRKELHEKMYGDSKDSEDLTQKLVVESFNLIENTKTAKRELKDAFDIVDKDLKQIIKALDQAEKPMSKFNDKDGSDVKEETLAYTCLIKVTELYKSSRTVLTAVYTMECQAIKDRNRQARAICGAAYRSRDKRDNESSVSEGFEHFSEAGRSVIAGVELV